MSSDRLIAILTLLAERESSLSPANTLCAVAAEVTHVSGAGISLAAANEVTATICASNGTAQTLMNAETTVGEGPCVDASSLGSLIEEDNLLTTIDHRWASYRPSALAAGARAVYAYPVRVGAIRLGALCLYRDRAGSLSADEESDGYLMASVIGRSILSLQASVPEEQLATALERAANLDFAIHQAAGMLSVQASLTVRDALVSLRAHAFATNIALAILAGEVVGRSTHFDPVTQEWMRDGGTDRRGSR